MAGVRDQPVGTEETLVGALNRLAAACDSPDASGCDMAVAIENGVMRFGREVWIDLAVVVIRDLKTGRQAHSCSAGVEMPPLAVAEWAQSGGQGTVGQIMSARTGCDKQDPHVWITGGDSQRADLLAHAVRLARSTLSNERL